MCEVHEVNELCVMKHGLELVTINKSKINI